jgi:hypothetical protein
MSRQDSAKYLKAAEHATVASAQSANMPVYEQFDLFMALNDAAQPA